MYSYVMAVVNAPDELVNVNETVLTDKLNQPNGVIAFRENDSFVDGEGPVDALPVVEDVQRTQYGWSFTITRDNIVKYLTRRYEKWKEAAEQYTDKEFLQLNSQVVKLMAEAFSNEQGDMFYLSDGTVMTVQDFFRQILVEMDAQNINTITKYVQKVYTYHW